MADRANSLALSTENTTVTIRTPGQYTFCGPVNLNGNTATATLSPGFYYGGISINGNQAIVFNPGLYILGGGGLSINGNTSTMAGTGVTFYNTTGLSGYKTIKLNGNTQENLSAPTSGSLQGILFFQDRSIPTSGAGSIINGNSASTFDGALYFPTTDVTYNGNSSLNGYTILVAYDILWNGNSTVGQQLHESRRRLANQKRSASPIVIERSKKRWAKYLPVDHDKDHLLQIIGTSFIA